MIKNGKLGDNLVVNLINGGVIEYFDVNKVYAIEIAGYLDIALATSEVGFNIPKDKIKSWYFE